MHFVSLTLLYCDIAFFWILQAKYLCFWASFSRQWRDDVNRYHRNRAQFGLTIYLWIDIMIKVIPQSTPIQTPSQSPPIYCHSRFGKSKSNSHLQWHIICTIFQVFMLSCLKLSLHGLLIMMLLQHYLNKSQRTVIITTSSSTVSSIVSITHAITCNSNPSWLGGKGKLGKYDYKLLVIPVVMNIPNVKNSNEFPIWKIEIAGDWEVWRFECMSIIIKVQVFQVAHHSHCEKQPHISRHIKDYCDRRPPHTKNLWMPIDMSKEVRVGLGIWKFRPVEPVEPECSECH